LSIFCQACLPACWRLLQSCTFDYSGASRFCLRDCSQDSSRRADEGQQSSVLLGRMRQEVTGRPKTPLQSSEPRTGFLVRCRSDGLCASHTAEHMCMRVFGGHGDALLDPEQSPTRARHRPAYQEPRERETERGRTPGRGAEPPLMSRVRSLLHFGTRARGEERERDRDDTPGDGHGQRSIRRHGRIGK